jgi:hypothetical protein
MDDCKTILIGGKEICFYPSGNGGWVCGISNEMMDTLCQLSDSAWLNSAPIKQEPVAWMVYGLDGKSVCVTDNPTDFAEPQRALPLYTAPRHWVSLTDWDIRQITGWFGEIKGFTRELFDQIDARLKEKNHG